MRKDMPRLATVRSIEYLGPRKLATRGQMPLNEELLSPRQSIRSATPHYSYLRARRAGPVLQWLRQQVGRPWDAVYSELCETFDRRNGVYDCVLEKVLSNIEIHNVYLNEDQMACCRSPYGDYQLGGLYVHPTTRLLCLQEYDRMSRARWRAQQAAQAEVSKVQVSRFLQLRKLDGLWFWIELAEVTEPQYITQPAITREDGTIIPEQRFRVFSTVCRDVLSGRDFLSAVIKRHEQDQLVREYGAPNLYARSKRQASHKDVCRHVPTERLAA